MTAPRLPTLVTCSRLTRLSLLLVLVLLTGCRGCNSTSNDPLSKEELEKRRKEQQDALVANDIVSLPTDSQRALVSLKPGHWVETSQSFKSTREDLQVMAVGTVYRGQERVTLPATNFVNEFNRRTVLPKGQAKSISLQFFVPRTSASEQREEFDSNRALKRLEFGTELLAMPLMTPIPESNKRPAVNELKEHEYQLAVLSPQALSYQFLSGLDAVYWISSDLVFNDSRVRSYEVSLVEPKDNEYGLPNSLLTMTSLAVIIWDDVSPENLSDDQQQSMIDWLHWGGQLVVSGATSWSRLQGSFLSPYLPAVSADSVELTTESFSQLSSTWITKDLGKLRTTDPIEIVGPPIAGLAMKLGPRGAWLAGTGELVSESSIGRGRIIVTGFPLREPRIYRWPYFSSFFSTGVLRRWPRTFRQTGSAGEYVQSWAAPFGSDDLDPRLHSNFRMLSRDLSKTPLSASDSDDSQSSDLAGRAGFVDEIDPYSQLSSQSSAPDAGSPVHPDRNDGSESSPPSRPSNGSLVQSDIERRRHEPWNWEGAGTWNDYAGLSDDAVESLRAAAGIELPSRSTILKLLGGYLICLVPLNYLIFRLFRRLEFAWLAAPVLALIGVVVVTRVAQLDIGFARRTIDLGILEMYDDYPRGHLTQYLALYTSLSTNYSLEFPEKDSAALPLGDVQRESRRAQMSTRELRTSFGRTDGVILEPVTVYSNSTETLRSEQVLSLAAPVRLELTEQGTQAVANGSELTIQDCLLLRMTEDRQFESAWMGTLDSGSRQSISWQRSDLENSLTNWQKQTHTQPDRPVSEELQNLKRLWIGGLLDRIARQYPLMPGASVLIGHSEEPLGSIKISPEQDQYDRSCVVVVHLSKPVLGPVKPDVSIMSRAEVAEAAEADADAIKERENKVADEEQQKKSDLGVRP